ncbi:hypothetical protein GCM10010873_03380 [Cypionkella aquatica]|uniref:Uncharacterized protein n=1 Tax=Cypionkella aquatica TaxID=1756042 RepID=A0AA37TTG6_9RHOB|nr:hypothetical protein GCM10010873_03380 [Cypionkella aquatica]
MVALAAKDKGQCDVQQRYPAVWRQAIGFGLVEVNHKADRGGATGGAVQDADTARLYLTADRGGACGDKLLVLRCDFGLIIRDQCGA